jgi:hypothetical protein
MNLLRTRFGSLAIWGILVLALVAWGGFAYLISHLANQRAEYVDRAAVAEQESERNESTARLRALVQGTEVERAAIESVVSVRIVDAAEIIEEAVRAAGAREIEIREASARAPTASGITGVSVGVSATGSFSALVRAILLLETLTLPSTLEQFELSKNEDEWRLIARLRLSLAAVQ